ncbi:MAG: ATP-dependent 6-phosphofructokinase [Proteobacteria bacterium]|nr:ATP-dependent 6-phosphofructokinase [Pseudomonadota bacterium]
MNKRIGILTGGGDCPGLNALIRAVVKSAIHEQGWEAVGILDGFEGLLWPGRYTKLSYDDVSGILASGGTILGSSNRINPFAVKEEKDGQIITSDRSGEVVRVIKRLGLDVLFVTGGDGTMTISAGINALGVPVIGVPKTIDNDLRGTDFTIGFDTAVTIASEAIDRLRTTAQSHHRVMVVEVMGRNAGWIALESGIASGADIVLIPEIPFSYESICRAIELRNRKGRRYTIVVVAEGARWQGGKPVVQREVKTSAEPIRLGGIGEVVTHEIESRTGIETRVTVLGHVQRGGTPTARDRNLATLFGIEAVRAAGEGKTGIYVVLHGKKITRLPLRQAAQGIRRVSLNCPQVQAARAIGMRFGNEK